MPLLIARCFIRSVMSSMNLGIYLTALLGGQRRERRYRYHQCCCKTCTSYSGWRFSTFHPICSSRKPSPRMGLLISDRLTQRLVSQAAESAMCHVFDFPLSVSPSILQQDIPSLCRCCHPQE
jgi:hypothetical protein